jgi:hypothetical protein
MPRDPTHDPPERRSGNWRPSLSQWFAREAVADERVQQARDREAAALLSRAEHAERVIRLQWAVIGLLVIVVVSLAGRKTAVEFLGLELEVEGEHVIEPRTRRSEAP